MGKPENTEKRIGKRKGPLKPDQRKQASEIRKLRACLRCKFLKKTVSTFYIDHSILFSVPNKQISATRVNLVLAASLHMLVCGKFLARELISRRLGIS
jgi:hypothetical protein